MKRKSLFAPDDSAERFQRLLKSVLTHRNRVRTVVHSGSLQLSVVTYFEIFQYSPFSYQAYFGKTWGLNPQAKLYVKLLGEEGIRDGILSDIEGELPRFFEDKSPNVVKFFAETHQYLENLGEIASGLSLRVSITGQTTKHRNLNLNTIPALPPIPEDFKRFLPKVKEKSKAGLIVVKKGH